MGKLRGAVVRSLEMFLAVAFAVLTLDVLWGVFSRYVLGAQSPWTEELAIYLLIWVSLVGASVTYADKGHLGLDYFVGKMEASAQRVAALAVEAFVSAFAVFAMIYGGYVLVERTIAAKQVSPALGVPMGWIYLAVPIGGVFLLLFSVENALRLLTESSSPQPASAPTPDESAGEPAE